MNRQSYSKTHGGFTLIELLVVIAIIGILSSVVLASLSGARESARDAKRVQDFRELRRAVLQYEIDNGQYPGQGDTDNQLSKDCTSIRIYNDLVPEYLSEMPTDPAENITECSDLYTNSSDDPDNDDFFYGWDYHNGGAGRDFCISINQFESWAPGESPISGYNETLSNGFGADANMDGADFASCFVDA